MKEFLAEIMDEARLEKGTHRFWQRLTTAPDVVDYQLPNPGDVGMLTWNFFGLVSFFLFLHRLTMQLLRTCSAYTLNMRMA